MSASPFYFDRFVDVGKIAIRLEGDLGVFRAKLTCEEVEPQVHLVEVHLTADNVCAPAPFKLEWRCPIVDIQALWHPACYAKRWLTLPWEVTLRSQATKEAPVINLHNSAGANRLTFACSDVLNQVELTASVQELDATLACHLHFFNQPTAPLREYRAILYLDQRSCPYHRSLHDVEVWWGLKRSPLFVPDVARQPVYSTWYSFHQDMTDIEVEKQCRLAQEYGCESVIIDDGWQTEDKNRGYAYCGDWEICEKKFPDMAAHVARLQQIGMKSLLWFSVPFIGFKSQSYARFQGKYLYEKHHMQAAVLDPRYPEVREYLINLYERAILVWGFDGLKLDFVDEFVATEANYLDDPAGRDIHSVLLAVDRLLRDTRSRLTRLKSDVLIEFRQPYIGPLMQHYGNIFRASDCPNDAIGNRVRTIDIRLLAGSAVTHSDMLMWSQAEAVESAAQQFLNIIFSVPQISVKIDRIPPDHQRMLRFWLRFWRDHRDALLDGALEPFYPHLQYPFVLAKTKQKWIGAHYADIAAPLFGALPEEMFLINATHQSRIILDIEATSGIYHVKERNALGEIIEERTQTFWKGISALTVPPSGVLQLRRR